MIISANRANAFTFSICRFCIALKAECWRGQNDTHGFDGIPHNITTLAECQAACVNSRTCVAVDWEPSNYGKTCWILTSTISRGTLHTGVITHYELDRSCSGEFSCYCTHCTLILGYNTDQEFNFMPRYRPTAVDVTC